MVRKRIVWITLQHRLIVLHAYVTGVMKAFDDTREGNLDYRKFCELVMGSTKTTSSSLAMGAQAVNGLHNYSSAVDAHSTMHYLE